MNRIKDNKGFQYQKITFVSILHEGDLRILSLRMVSTRQ